jgi:hypothetical protein
MVSVVSLDSTESPTPISVVYKLNDQRKILDVCSHLDGACAGLVTAEAWHFGSQARLNRGRQKCDSRGDGM